jgi:hypothetical protein
MLLKLAKFAMGAHPAEGFPYFVGGLYVPAEINMKTKMEL